MGRLLRAAGRAATFVSAAQAGGAALEVGGAGEGQVPRFAAPHTATFKKHLSFVRGLGLRRLLSLLAAQAHVSASEGPRTPREGQRSEPATLCAKTLEQGPVGVRALAAVGPISSRGSNNGMPLAALSAAPALRAAGLRAPAAVARLGPALPLRAPAKLHGLRRWPLRPLRRLGEARVLGERGPGTLLVEHGAVVLALLIATGLAATVPAAAAAAAAAGHGKAALGGPRRRRGGATR